MRNSRTTVLFSVLVSAFLACVVFATGTVVLVVAAPDAQASEECDFVNEPADFFEVRDRVGTYSVQSDLSALTTSLVQRQRRVALFQVDGRGFASDSVRALTTYFDSVLSWLEYLRDPCADAVAYPGPFTVAPTVPAAPYGFGGVDAVAIEPMVLRFTEADPSDSSAASETAQSAALFANQPDDGTGLAHSGSESFVLAYFGVGMMAFGATALGMRRWMSGPTGAHAPSARGDT